MCLSAEDQSEFSLLADTLKELKEFDVAPKKTSAADFDKGTKKTQFDFVIAPLFNMNAQFSEGDLSNLEEAKEFYTNYSNAPIFIFVASQDLENSKALLKQTVRNSELVMVDADSREARAKAVLAAYKQAKAKYDSLKEKVVVPQFKKYDEDGSGAIDKQELSKLCKDLGQPLDDS